MGSSRIHKYGKYKLFKPDSRGQPQTAPEAIAIWCLSQILVIPYIARASARALGVGPLRPLREAVPMALLTGLAVVLSLVIPDRFGLVTTPGHQIGWQLAVGGAVVGGGLLLRFAYLQGRIPAWPSIGPVRK